MPELLNTKVDELRDELLISLIAELELACEIEASPLTTIGSFLICCVYPFGFGSKRVRISTDHLPMTPVLDTRVGRLPDGPVYGLCRELARDVGLELFHGERLKNFLSRRIPSFPAHKTASETARRRDALVHLRRRNR